MREPVREDTRPSGEPTPAWRLPLGVFISGEGGRHPPPEVGAVRGLETTRDNLPVSQAGY